MSEIDKTLLVVGLYIIFSIFLSYLISFLSDTDKKKPTSVPKASPAIGKEKPVEAPKKSKKEKLIKNGFQALCNVCERYFESDTYLKNHLEGQKHLKKAKAFKGDIYQIVKK